MRKSVVGGILIVVSILLIGCLDYKAYDIPKGEQGAPAQDQELDSLVDEIAAIEKQLEEETPTGAVTEEVPEEVADVAEEAPEELTEEVEEEVVLPDLEAAAGREEDALEMVTVKENELIRLHVKVMDPDNDKVTFSFSKPLNSNGEWKTSYGDAGDYTVTITATDGKLTTDKKVRIIVERVNVPPAIESLRDLSASEGETITFTPTVSDPNKDKVTVTVSEPLRTGTFKTDHTSAGEYQITVTVSDGELETEKSFKLRVADVNVLPEISNLPEEIRVREGEVVEINPAITDLDEDEITLTIGEPVGTSGLWETGYTDHGTYQVPVAVSDGKDTIVKKVAVIVEDVNMPPEIVEVYLS